MSEVEELKIVQDNLSNCGLFLFKIYTTEGFYDIKVSSQVSNPNIYHEFSLEYNFGELMQQMFSNTISNDFGKDWETELNDLGYKTNINYKEQLQILLSSGFNKLAIKLEKI